MRGTIVKYIDICQTEGASLQRGMNFRGAGKYSIFLMSTRPNAPYRDRVEDEGLTLIYEGHDAKRSPSMQEPKLIDQPERTPFGTLTENGKFFKAAAEFTRGTHAPMTIRVYEKLRDGIWADNGFFRLTKSWQEHDGRRNVFKFRLEAVDDEPSDRGTNAIPTRTRVIPSSVKQEVWLRDGGKCTQCGAQDELHFDHVIPYSRGGSSLVVANVQLLCARHNLTKSAKIE